MNRISLLDNIDYNWITSALPPLQPELEFNGDTQYRTVGSVFYHMTDPNAKISDCKVIYVVATNHEEVLLTRFGKIEKAVKEGKDIVMKDVPAIFISENFVNKYVQYIKDYLTSGQLHRGIIYGLLAHEIGRCEINVYSSQDQHDYSLALDIYPTDQTFLYNEVLRIGSNLAKWTYVKLCVSLLLKGACNPIKLQADCNALTLVSFEELRDAHLFQLNLLVPNMEIVEQLELINRQKKLAMNRPFEITGVIREIGIDLDDCFTFFGMDDAIRTLPDGTILDEVGSF